MGDAGSGKSSMRAVIFKNTLPDLTYRLSSTHSYERENFRFFGGPNSNAPTLSLWDCASQRGFVESYLSEDGQATVFAHASTMIYVFEVTKLVNGRPPEMSMDYFSRCLEALDRQSPGAPVFVLIQKMDLVQPAQKQADFDAWITGVKAAAGDRPLTVYGTSIYEDTLYRAWSAIIRILVPNVSDLSRNLSILSKSCGAIETVIFEKNTFLLVAKSTVDEPESDFLMVKHNVPDDQEERHAIQSTKSHGPINRFEVITKLIKTFKNDSRRHSSETFESLRMEIADFTLVLESLTATSYVLVIASNEEPRISPEAIALNISMVRARFEQLQIAAK